MAATETFVDPFTGPSIDTNLWNVSGSGFSINTGAEALQVSGSGTLSSKSTYDIADSYIVFGPVTGLSASTGAYVRMGLKGSGSNGLQWDLVGLVGGSISAGDVVDGSSGSTRTHSDGTWYRIRHSGSTVYFEYSSDGESWSVHRSTTSFNQTTGLTVTIEASLIIGSLSGLIGGVNEIPDNGNGNGNGGGEDPPVSGALAAKVYLDGEWVEKPLKYHDGESWVLVPRIRVWDGESWVPEPEPEPAYPETRLYHDFTQDEITSVFNEVPIQVAPEGMEWLAFPTHENAVAQIQQSPVTGKNAYTNYDQSSTVVRYSHLANSPPLPTTIFYGFIKFHADTNGSTFGWAVGLIAWSNPLVTPQSVCHIVLLHDRVLLQEFDDTVQGDVRQQVTHMYDSSITDGREQFCEFAISIPDEAVVVRCPDGAVISLQTPNVKNWLMNWLDLEIGYNNATTDRHIWVTEGGCDWYDHEVSQEVIDHANALLDAEGYGPAGPAVATIATGTTCPLPPHEAGDYLVACGMNIAGDSTPGLPSGWTNLTNASGFGSKAIRAAYIQADGTQTQVTMSSADMVIVYNAKSLVPGAAANSTGTDSTAEIPSLTLQVTNGSSKVLCFTITVDADGTWSTPSGLEKVIEYSGADGGAAFITTSGVSSWSGAVSTYSGGSGRWRAVAVELKAA